MEAFIRKWGNSPALRLPSVGLAEAGYCLNQRVDIIISRARIVIRPIENKSFELKQLVEGINEQNQQTEIDYGRPVGKEIL